MAVRLTLTVADITGTLSSGYTRLKIYRAPQQAGLFEEITTPSTTVQLLSGVSDYSFIDGNGTTAHWYKTTFYNPSLPAESSFSIVFNGEFYDLSFPGVSYDLEAVYTNDDYLVIDKVRNLIGDRKELIREYVSPETEYTNVSLDRYTYSFANPNGWPLKIVLDGSTYPDRTEPVVNGYKMITFSGTQITTSGVLDIWYYHFRFSDSEILQAYNSFIPPEPLSAADVTFELVTISTAIDLLLGELGMVSSSAGIEVDIFEEIRVNPKAGLDSRFNTLKLLLQRRNEIIDEIEDSLEEDIFGVLID